MKLLDEFVLKGSPSTVTAQQKGESVIHGRIHHYKKSNVRKAEADLAVQLLGHVPDRPYQGNIYLRLMWLFNKKALTKKESRTFKSTRPDIDNLYKGIADVMVQMGFFEDDSRIVSLDLTKAWSKEYPGLFFQIWELGDSDYELIVEDWRNRA